MVGDGSISVTENGRGDVITETQEKHKVKNDGDV